jgi:transcriptional regulator with XRE-family HTH domain
MAVLLDALARHCKQYRGAQRKVAEYCQCSPSTVSDWLHGRVKPTGEQVLAILDLLHLVGPLLEEARGKEVAEPVLQLSGQR